MRAAHAAFAMGLSVAAGPALPCGFSAEQNVYVFENRPADPVAFARGQLGILAARMSPSHLIVALRHLHGAALSAAEQEAVVRAWADHEAPVTSPPDATGVWMQARERHLPRDERMRTHLEMDGEFYGYVPNCQDDALLTAAKTLEAREREYPNADWVKRWVAAQDQVFSNCDGGGTIPEPLGEDAPPLARADRAYQIAAAHFYAGNYDEAARRFEELAGDTASPWREWGDYLGARARVRKGLFGAGGDRDATALDEAVAHLEALCERSPEDRRLRRLLAYARLRAAPDVEAVALTSAMLESFDREELAQEFVDLDAAFAREGSSSRETAPDDAADWLCVMTTRCELDPNDIRHSELLRGDIAVARYLQSGALHWLVAALVHAERDTPGVLNVLEAAERVPVASAAAHTVAFHRARLLVELGRTREAERLLQDLHAPRSPALDVSSHNRVTALQLRLADNVAELAASVLQVRLGTQQEQYFTADHPPALRCAPAEAVEALNTHLPLHHWTQLVAGREQLSGFALAGFIRAALLDDVERGRTLVTVLAQRAPAVAEELAGWSTAADAPARQFELAYFLLKHRGWGPLLSADTCVAADGHATHGTAWCVVDADSVAALPHFPAALRVHAQAELEALARLGTDLDFVTRVVTQWARTHPDDPRAPEALHRAVLRARNNFCRSEDTQRLSRTAFRLLHKRFAGSAWAKKTPYWY